MTDQETTQALLRVRDLHVHFPTDAGLVRAVSGVNLELREAETVAVVGESGCGKSTVARAIMGIESPASGELSFRGERLQPGRRRKSLAKRLQMIFQDPEASLNPRLTIGATLAEPLKIHYRLSTKERDARITELMNEVGIDPSLSGRYPHELSGGQRQRTSIARALAVEPEALILDEAVSALDVSIQAQILNLLVDLQSRLGLAYLFITHDLGVVRHLAHRVVVMYLGRVVEVANTDALFAAPSHPYTQALLDAVPDIDHPDKPRRKLGGDVPSPLAPPSGCHFHPRCPEAIPACSQAAPPLLQLPSREVRCILRDPATQPAANSQN